jgi:hypothetical protein
MMTSLIVPMALALSMASTGQVTMTYPRCLQPATFPLPPGPGYGWGFPNGAPVGHGYFDPGTCIPLGADRTTDYFFRRYYSAPTDQLFMATYYNPYMSRGQRYVPYAGCGGEHPAGGLALSPAETPMNPYQNTIGSGPQVPIPGFTGRVEAPPINSGNSGLTP